MPVTPDAIFRSILMDKRTPLRIRLQALQSMTRPSLRLLYKLVKDKSIKVRFEAAKLLALELDRKELRKRAKQRQNSENT
jgi:hypothetical protein